MPQKKTKNTHPVKKRNILLLTLLVLVSLLILAMMGKFALSAATKQLELEQEKTTLSETLEDMSVVYKQFLAFDSGLKRVEQPLENKCSEISSKGTAKMYTCGTRAQVLYVNGNEEAFHSISNALQKSITHAFDVDKVYGDGESSIYNALTTQLHIHHNRTGQECDIYGTYYREKETFTNQPNEIRFSFHCNLEARAPIFKLED